MEHMYDCNIWIDSDVIPDIHSVKYMCHRCKHCHCFHYQHHNNKLKQLTQNAANLTHLPLVPNICVGELNGHRSVNGLAPSHCLNQCWVIVNWSLGTNFSEFLIKIITFSFKKMCLKLSYAKCRLFCSSEEEFKMVYHTAVSSCLALIRYSRGV